MLAMLLLAGCTPGRHSGSGSGREHDEPAASTNSSSALSAREKISWTTFGYDPARTGVNPEEKLVTAATVGGLRRVWRTQLPAVADSSPVLLHDLEFPQGPRDVLYATTKDGAIVALDATSGEILWSHAPTGPQITTSSPVVDPSKRLVFSYGLDGAVHKYDAVSGEELKGGAWPVPITLMPETEKGSSALNRSGGRIYATTSAYVGDAPPYQGHVVGVDEATGDSEVFNSLCSSVGHLLSGGECPSQGSGIWGRGGAVVDPATGDAYATTGNGPYDANVGGQDYGDSVLRLEPDNLRLLDSYTPETYRELEETDADLGSASPALLPRIPKSQTPFMLVQGGKDGKLRLIDREGMSGAGGPGRVGGELQEIDSAGCDTFTQPVVRVDAKGGVRVIVAGTCGIAAYDVSTDAVGTSRLRLAWKTDDESTTPVIAGGVLFAATSGALLALDPQTGRHLWSSEQESAGGTIGAIHWESPIAVNGRLYVPDESGAMTAYGLPGNQEDAPPSARYKPRR